VRSTEVGRDRVLSYVSDHRSGGAGGTSACSSWRAIRRYPGLKRLQVGQPGSSAVRGGRPGGLAALLQWSHADTMIRVRFRRSRGSTPSDRSDGLWAHLATLRPSQARSSRLTNEAPASEEAGFFPDRRSDRPPEGGWPASGPGASANWTWQARSQVPPPRWVRAHRSGRGSTRSADWPVG
jgi:hypothetical protein